MSEIKIIPERLTVPVGDYAIEIEEADGFPIRRDPLPRTPSGKVLKRALRDGVPEPAAEDSSL